MKSRYTAMVKNPCNVQSNSPQAEIHRCATVDTHPEYFREVKIFVDGSRIFINSPRYYTGVINRRAAGGRWEEITDKLERQGIAIDTYLESIKATCASFKGQPRT